MAKVLFVSLVFAPDGVSTSYLMTELAVKLRARGHEVTVLTTVPHYNFEPEAQARQPLARMWLGLLRRSEIGGVRVIHVPVRRKAQRVIGRVLDHLHFHIMSTLAGLIAAGRYDVVFAPSPPLTIGVNAWLLASARGVPLIYNVQEIYPDAAVELGVVKQQWLLRVLSRIERFVYARSQAVTVIGERFRNNVVSKGVPHAKVRVIANFVSAHGALANGRSLADAPRSDNPRFTVLYAGNLGLAQDLDTLLAAAALLRDRQDIAFVVVGDGARRKWLEHELAARGSANVTLLPYLPASEVAGLYASCDVGLVPMKKALAHTTFPSKAYSIMSAGRALLAVAEADSEIGDLVQRAQCGVLVPPGDPQLLARMIADLAARRADLVLMGERGKAYIAAHHTCDLIAGQYDSLIGELARTS